MYLLEDLLTSDELAAIDKVLNSDKSRFDLLVELAGLNPKHDFKNSDLRCLNLCGADLRGFDFTGSDLRQCVRNQNTIIDKSTILEHARIDWIDVETLPIVEKMQQVEVASGDLRQKLLLELTTEFGITQHVVAYIVSAASRAHTLDDFLDFALFLPAIPTEGQSDTLKATAKKLLKRRIARSKSRTRRDGTVKFAIENIYLKMQKSNGKLADRIYTHLAEIVNEKQSTRALNGIANVEQEDLELAFDRIGK